MCNIIAIQQLLFNKVVVGNSLVDKPSVKEKQTLKKVVFLSSRKKIFQRSRKNALKNFAFFLRILPLHVMKLNHGQSTINLIATETRHLSRA